MKSRTERIKSILLVLLGNTMTAAAFAFFILPAGFLAGGVTGSSRLIAGAVGLPLSIVVLAINLALFAAGYKVMGKDFAAKTVISTFYFPFALAVLQHIPSPVSSLPVAFTAVAGGIILGAGGALVINGKGSNGGYDVLAIILNRWRGIPISPVVNGIDIFLILLQLPGATAGHLVGGLLTTGVCLVVMSHVLRKEPEEESVMEVAA